MKSDIIHIASIKPEGRTAYLFLKKKDPRTYQWFEENHETEVKGITPEEALRLAKKHWQYVSFRFVHCGFRFTLPERDEHGGNALFCQMAASYASSNGIYFDEELGHSCIVKNASSEAVQLLKQLAS